MTDFFELQATCGAARAGRLRTDHGEVETPVFMAVGTQGTVKGVTPDQLANTGTKVVLGNTYHLMLRPGPMPWPRWAACMPWLAGKGRC